MPTFRHGRNTYFSLRGTAGAIVNLSSGLNQIDFNRQLDTAEVSHYGLFDREYVVGMRGSEFTISGMFSSTHALHMDRLLGADFGSTGSTNSGLFTFGPEGPNTARKRYLGRGIMTSLNYGAPYDDMVSMEFGFQVTGLITSSSPFA